MADSDKPRKTGPKPKPLKTATYTGIEVGRKKVIIDPDEVQKLAALGCKDHEIAEWFLIDSNSLRYNFSAQLIKGRNQLKQSIRKAQIQLALGGNAVMLIWLGKNILGQSDSPLDQDVEQKILPWCSDTDRQSE